MLKKIKKVVLPIIILIALVVAVIAYWRHNILFPSTDDAYVKAHVLSIAPQISGNTQTVLVTNHQFVSAGQMLFTIDDTATTIALQKAQANLDDTKQQIQADTMAVQSAKAIVAQRKAELIDATADAYRTTTLAKEQYESKSARDMAIKDLHVAQAAYHAAQAQLEQAQQTRGTIGKKNAKLRAAQTAVANAKLNLSYTKVVAPAAGYIANFDLRPGDTVTAYQPVFSLIESHTLWLEANFKETQLARIRVGDPATIELDMYPGKTFHGTVASISDGSGASFSLLPPENATGNWVKVTQRFPVKIMLRQQEQAFPLRLGASATVTVDTSHDKP